MDVIVLADHVKISTMTVLVVGGAKDCFPSPSIQNLFNDSNMALNIFSVFSMQVLSGTGSLTEPNMKEFLEGVSGEPNLLPKQDSGVAPGNLVDPEGSNIRDYRIIYGGGVIHKC